MELHRAWHMTLFTSKILQQIKDKFDMRMTWDLGVVRLVFRVEDGGFELHRKVPYDYDSEYQDIYLRIAEALIDGEINVHEALNYQSETKKGLHTAKSGLFLRDFPGRLILYPLEAATCTMIFFKGDLADAGVAAICGAVAGLIDMILGRIGGDMKILVDITVGITTGIIGGLFHRFGGQYCISSIFLGTLYWFFYGTAFVVGILEIIAGELQTGVTRFIAVSVKTFVLSLGAALGLMIASGDLAINDWFQSEDQCTSAIDEDPWYRVPLYLLCSVSVLGQYRAPVIQYWRGLIVMLCAYEAQWRSYAALMQQHSKDNLDTSTSNIVGAAVGVIVACILASIINIVRRCYKRKLLAEGKLSKMGNLVYKFMAIGVRCCSCLVRASDYEKLTLKMELQKQRRELFDNNNSRTEIKLTKAEEHLVIETIVGNQDMNVWSILMPALYQLVPGSIIAKLWFNSIFPPVVQAEGASTDSVFANLMVISTSLALGLIVGFVVIQCAGSILLYSKCLGKVDEKKKRALGRLAGMYNVPITKQDDQFAASERSAAQLRAAENNGDQSTDNRDSTASAATIVTAPAAVGASDSSLTASASYFPVPLDTHKEEEEEKEAEMVLDTASAQV